MARSILAILTFFVLAGIAEPAARAAAPGIRFLLPYSSFSAGAQLEISRIVEEYNQIRSGNPTSQVQLIRRGDDFSSLRELISMALAGETPDVAAIGYGETPSLAKIGILRAFPAPFQPDAAVTAPGDRDPNGTWLAFPWVRTIPVWVADEEALEHLEVRIADLTTWEALTRAGAKLAVRQPSPRGGLTIPLQGFRGLWIFEALSNQPLWNREAGGLRSNRQLRSSIQSLQALLEAKGSALPAAQAISWDHALQAFLDRSIPLVVLSSDALTAIQPVATFRYVSGPLPLPNSGRAMASIAHGSSLVVTKDSPAVAEFLAFLLSPAVSARLARAGGFVPLHSSWTKEAAWNRAPLDIHQTTVLRFSKNAKPRPRTTDAEVVRARSAWIQSLPALFGQFGQRLSFEQVFLQLDRMLNTK